VDSVGTLIAIWRFPVKSMAGEQLDGAEISWHGITGDRRWAFIQPGLERSNFPWLTIRELPQMWRYEPRLAEPGRPDASATIVRTPSGAEYDVADPQLAAELGDGVRVIKQNRGVFDAAPLSLISTQSVGAIDELVRPQLVPKRFRPNLVIETSGPYREDDWVGHTLTIGSMRMRVDRRDERCVITSTDPETTAVDPSVLKTIGRERNACLGVYGTPVDPGRVAVGDEIYVD
jgi:MOSC domain-containing protein